MGVSVGYCMIVILFLCLMLGVYCFLLHQQIRKMNILLEKRLKEHTRQPLSLELVSRELNALAVNINRCLKEEEELRIRLLREENNFKEMIVNISHDLRTPLTAVKGYLQLLHRTSLDAEQSRKLEIACRHTEDLGILIEHFFEYTYLADTEPEVELNSFNLTNLTAECVAAAVPLLEEAGIEVDMEEEPHIVLADREMTQRIIQNLVRNCIKYSKSNIIIRFTEESGITMHFMNTVDAESIIEPDKIFDRFYSADKTAKSTGLGLAIVKMLAGQMGGRTEARIRNGMIDIMVTFQKAPNPIQL